MWIKIRKCFVFLFFFVLCFAITNNIVKITNILTQFNFRDNIEDERILNALNAIWSFAVTFFLQVYNEKRKENMRKMPYLSIKSENITSERRSRWGRNLTEVVLGYGKYFIYATAKLMNSGEGSIEECYINEKKLNINLIRGEEFYEFCFKICREQNRKYKKFYTLNIQFSDSMNRNYKGIMLLNLRQNKKTVKIYTLKNQRRKLL